VDFKFRPIGIFDAMVVAIEEVKGDDERWQLSFACPGRTGSGAKAKTGSIEAVAGLIGGVVKAKVSKKYLHMLKSIGINIGSRCTLYAAIDNYAIPAEGKNKAANGLWFELIEVQLGDKKVEAPLEQKVT
jgi:hypothetical protein